MKKILCLSLMLMSSTAMARDIASGDSASGLQVSSNDPLTVEGSVTNTTVGTYGQMTVRDGGQADTTTVGRRGTLTVTGVGSLATNTILNSSSQLNVTNGATANGVMVNSSAKVYVGDQSIVNNATLNGGSLEILSGGISNGAVINDGYVFVENDGEINRTIVNGGLLDVFAGGKINDLTLNGGETVFEGDATVNGKTIIKPNGYLYLHGNTTFENLQFDNGSIYSVYNDNFKNINVTTLEGNGIIHMNTNVAQDKHDILNVTNGGSGQVGLALTDYSATPVFSQNMKLINGLPAENFYLIGGAADVGAFHYDLAKLNDGWYLVKTLQLSDTAVLAKNTYAAIHSVMYAHLQNLNNRLGEIHTNKNGGFWVRGMHRQLDLDFDDATQSDVEVNGVQFGYDYALPQNTFNRWLIGVHAGYSDTTQDFDRSGDGNADTYSFGAYTTMIAENGLYADIAATYYRHKQKLSSYLPHGAQVNSDYDVDGYSLSLEGGKRFNLANGYYLEPQAQVSYIGFDNIEYRTSYNTLIEAENQGTWLARAGLIMGKRLENKYNMPIDVFVRTDFYTEVDNGHKVTVAGYDIEEDRSENFVRLGAGMNLNTNQGQELYLGVGTILGGKVQMPIDLSLNARWEF